LRPRPDHRLMQRPLPARAREVVRATAPNRQAGSRLIHSGPSAVPRPRAARRSQPASLPAKSRRARDRSSRGRLILGRTVAPRAQASLGGTTRTSSDRQRSTRGLSLAVTRSSTFSGMLLFTCGNGEPIGGDPPGQCYYDIELRPIGEATDDQVGIPSPVVTSSTDTYPEPEIGACCLDLGPDVDAEELANALDLVCLADCGARACEEVSNTLTAIWSNDACFYGDAFNPAACPLFLGEACVGNDHYQDCRPKPAPFPTCDQVQLLGATRSDLLKLIELLQSPTGFQKCQDDIVDEAGWRPCVTVYPECNGWNVDNGRFNRFDNQG
jgi:hypothetical protein